MATKKKFTPMDYLTPAEIKEAIRIRNKIETASTVRQVQIYGKKMKSLIRLAYNRKLQGIKPGEMAKYRSSPRYAKFATPTINMSKEPGTEIFGVLEHEVEVENDK